jgi:hypothetical protein
MIDIVKRLRSSDVLNAPVNVEGVEVSPIALMAATEIEMLRAERDRLAKELAEAHKAILPWIDQVGWLNAEWFRHRDALKKIAGTGMSMCVNYKDVAERQFAIADEALKEGDRER